MSARNQSEDNKMTELLNRVQKSIAVVFFFFFNSYLVGSFVVIRCVYNNNAVDML